MQMLCLWSQLESRPTALSPERRKSKTGRTGGQYLQESVLTAVVTAAAAAAAYDYRMY